MQQYNNNGSIYSENPVGTRSECTQNSGSAVTVYSEFMKFDGGVIGYKFHARPVGMNRIHMTPDQKHLMKNGGSALAKKVMQDVVTKQMRHMSTQAGLMRFAEQSKKPVAKPPRAEPSDPRTRYPDEAGNRFDAGSLTDSVGASDGCYAPGSRQYFADDEYESASNAAAQGGYYVTEDDDDEDDYTIRAADGPGETSYSAPAATPPTPGPPRRTTGDEEHGAGGGSLNAAWPQGANAKRPLCGCSRCVVKAALNGDRGQMLVAKQPQSDWSDAVAAAVAARAAKGARRRAVEQDAAVAAIKGTRRCAPRGDVVAPVTAPPKIDCRRGDALQRPRAVEEDATATAAAAADVAIKGTRRCAPRGDAVAPVTAPPKIDCRRGDALQRPRAVEEDATATIKGTRRGGGAAADGDVVRAAVAHEAPTNGGAVVPRADRDSRGDARTSDDHRLFTYDVRPRPGAGVLRCGNGKGYTVVPGSLRPVLDARPPAKSPAGRSRRAARCAGSRRRRLGRV